MKRSVAAALLALAAASAHAAIVVEGVTAQPNPVSFEGATPPQVSLVVTVTRALTDRQNCDVLVEPGDGSAPVRLSFLNGEQRKAVPHQYTAPGAYTVRAVAAYGCTGTRTANLTVFGGSYPAPTPAVAAATPGPAVPAPQGGCPSGWYVVPESVDGARYSCRPNLPATPLRCAAGTRYFAENGVIGCR